MLTYLKQRLVLPSIGMTGALMLAGFLPMGCGGSEEPAPAETPIEVAAAPDTAVEEVIEEVQETAAAAAETVAEAVGIADGAPATVHALQYAPDSAHIAIALPPLDHLVNHLLPVATRAAPGDIDLEAEFRKVVADLARDAGVADAEDLQTIARAKGIDPDQAVGIFMNLERTIRSLPELAGDDAEENEEPAMPESAEIPAVALLLGVTDEDEARNTLRELIAQSPDLSAQDMRDEFIGEQAIHILESDKFAYTSTSSHLIVGSDPDMVKAVYERLGAPVQPRYGTSECPANTPNEIVALIHGARIGGVAADIMEMLDDDPANAFARAQLASYLKAIGTEGDDPAVLTIGADDNKLEVLLRMDTETHPGLLEQSGEAHPLRLARLLPEHTLAFLTLRVNPEFKAQFRETYLPVVQDLVPGDAGGAQGMTMAQQLLEMIGDEITLGITGVDMDFPEVFLMVALANPEPTKGLLQMLVPMLPGEEHRDVALNGIAAPVPIPLSLAFPGDMLLLSNNVDSMKKIIDRVLDEEHSGLFASLDPPLNPDTPRYQALLINTALLTDVILPLSALQGGLPGPGDEIATQVGTALRELRFSSEMDGTWSATRLSLYLRNAQ